MANIKFKNNASSKLSTSISSSDTTLRVVGGTETLFPTITDGEYFIATINGTDGKQEIVRVTATSGNIFTIVRAQEGTTASAFEVDSIIENRLTAGSLEVVTDINSATETEEGIVRIATAAEVEAGTSNTSVITPANAKPLVDSITAIKTPVDYATEHGQIGANVKQLTSAGEFISLGSQELKQRGMYWIAPALDEHNPTGLILSLWIHVENISDTYVHQTLYTRQAEMYIRVIDYEEGSTADWENVTDDYGLVKSLIDFNDVEVGKYRVTSSATNGISTEKLQAQLGIVYVEKLDQSDDRVQQTFFGEKGGIATRTRTNNVWADWVISYTIVNSSFSTSGTWYVEYSNGLIMQGGKAAQALTTYNITFPIPFPRNKYAIIPSPVSSSFSYVRTADYYTTNANVFFSVAPTAGMTWIAVGY